MPKEKTVASGQKFILVIEDDVAYANVYQRKLSKEGYEVVVEQSGEAAIELAKKRHPDLILLDLVMPGKNGFEVLQELRADPELKNVKIIVASNLSQDVDIEKAKKAGADDYFIKSNVSVPEMVQLVKESIH